MDQAAINRMVDLKNGNRIAERERVRADAIENYQRFQQRHCRQASSPPA